MDPFIYKTAPIKKNVLFYISKSSVTNKILLKFTELKYK